MLQSYSNKPNGKSSLPKVKGSRLIQSLNTVGIWLWQMLLMLLLAKTLLALKLMASASYTLGMRYSLIAQKMEYIFTNWAKGI